MGVFIVRLLNDYFVVGFVDKVFVLFFWNRVVSYIILLDDIVGFLILFIIVVLYGNRFVFFVNGKVYIY